MTGKLYGIGVPPGDPESLTFKAVIIGECKVIAIPGDDKKSCLAWKSVEKMVRGMQDKQILYIDMPMTKDREVLSQAHKKAAELIERELSKGEDVAFLTIGDPGVYSTYMYIHRELEGAGILRLHNKRHNIFCEAAALQAHAAVRRRGGAAHNTGLLWSDRSSRLSGRQGLHEERLKT